MGISGEIAGLPSGGPATPETACAQLGMTVEELTAEETARLALIVPAVNDEVRRLPVAARAVDADAWPDGVVLGAAMLCSRLFMRKNSPAGVLPFNDGAVAYVMRNDPDIGQLLKLGSYSLPIVG